IIFVTEISLGDFYMTCSQKVKSLIEGISARFKDYQANKRANESAQPAQSDSAVDIEQTDEKEPVIQDFADVTYSSDIIQKTPAEQEHAQMKEANEETLPDTLLTAETENHDYILPSLDILAKPRK